MVCVSQECKEDIFLLNEHLEIFSYGSTLKNK